MFATLLSFIFSIGIVSAQSEQNGIQTYLTVEMVDGMGIGNQMFIYAAMYGLAKTNKKTPIIKKSHPYPLKEYFTLSIPEYDGDVKFVTYGEETCCRYTTHLAKLPQNENVVINGYLNSFKYFEDNFNELREKEFRFRDNILDKCEISMKEIRMNTDNNNCTLVGIHARRGDFAYPDKRDFGHEPADSSYINNAIEYFRRRLSTETNCVRFIVLGNDFLWNINNIGAARDVIYLYPSQIAAVDMCILSKCQHTIATTGTFGWWSAFLANGLATFQPTFARPNSSHYAMFNIDTFLLPNAIRHFTLR